MKLVVFFISFCFLIGLGAEVFVYKENFDVYFYFNNHKIEKYFSTTHSEAEKAKFFEKEINESILEKIIALNKFDGKTNGFFLIRSNSACLDQLENNKALTVELNVNLLKENCEHDEVKKIGNSVFDYYKSKLYWSLRDIFDWL